MTMAGARARTTALVAAIAFAVPVATAATGERVVFPSLDIDPATGKPVMLNGLFFTPDLAGAGFPAVVVLHGCDGMYSRFAERRDRLTQRHQAMADLLLAEGYAVLFPDSFNPRGRREVCTLPARDQPISQDQRRLDVLGALDYLHLRQDIAANRIALVGWSHGGSTVLATMNARDPAVAAYIARHADPAGFFLTAVAFYPGCNASLRSRDGYAPAAPVRVFIGEADDWTSAKPCVALGEAMEAMDMPLHVRTYPDTYHGFDTPNLSKPQHLDMPNGVRPGSGVTIAANAEAREDAYARMKARLRVVLYP
jgi:dienelactone hydrolase